jgi:hypothetical protein
MRSALAAVALGASAALLAGAPAWASSSWLAPIKLSVTGQNAEAPEVGVDPQGDAQGIWVRASLVETSSSPAGSHSWQPPVTLSTKDMASVPRVALDSHGDAVAVWLSYDGSEYSIDEATRSGLNGPWQAPVTLEVVGMSLMEPPGPGLAVDAQGNAVVVWPREEKVIEAATGTAGGAFQMPKILSETAAAQHAAVVGIDASGNATAVWEDANTGTTLTTVASKPASGEWQTPKALSMAGENANEPRVAVDPRGDAVAAWERPEEGGGEELIEAAVKATSSPTWGKAVALTKPEGGKGEPAGQQVAIDGQGDAVAVWSRTNVNRDVIEVAEASSSSSMWQPPIALSAFGGNVEEAPQLSVNGQGEVVVVWERSNGTNEVIEAASGLAASDSWQAPIALSAPGQSAAEPQVALDSQGDAAAVWKRFDGTSYIAEAADLVNVPSTAVPISAPGATTKPPVPAPLAPPVAPRITGVRVSPSRFRVSKRPTAVSAKAKTKTGVPQGTSFHFTLSDAAQLQIVFTRPAAGLRSGKRCLAPSPKLARGHAKRCTRTLTVGTLTRAGEPAGASSLAFSGRIGTKALAPGAYKATLTASAGGLSSAPVTLALTVLR